MFDLTDVKLVAFDFDDTLYIHDKRNDTDKTDLEYYAGLMTKETDYYDPSRFSDIMGQLMFELNSRHIDMAVCSHTSFAGAAHTKVEAAEAHYGYPLINLCSGLPDYKHVILAAYALANGLKHEEILLIDDQYINLRNAEASGFKAANPMEVVLHYTNKHKEDM